MSRTLIGLAAAAALVLAACAQSPETVADNEVLPAVEDEATPTQAPPPRQEAAPARTPTARTYPAPAPAEQTRTASSTARPSMSTLPEGTILEVEISTRLSSGASLVGDIFMAEVVEDVRNSSGRVIPAGSTIHGAVSEVHKAKRGAGAATLGLTFTRIDLPGGFSSPLAASLFEETASKKKKNAAVIGGSAAGGAVLGRILGKDTKGAVIGSIIGGAIGTGVVLSKEGEQVDLPVGTALSIRLDDPLKVPGPA